MDKKFVENSNLNEAVKRFQEIANYKSPKQSLNEYAFFQQGQLEEEGENDGELQQPQNNMQHPQNPSPDAQNQGGGTNGQMGMEMPPQGEQIPQNGDMSAQGQDMMSQQGGDMGMQQPPMDGDMGEMPTDDGQQGEDMGGFGDADGDIETEEMEPDDEVIDVDDLTQSQEATEYKIDGVDDRLSEIFAVVKNFSDKLDKQEQSIMNLKDEFEKRNPTQTEKFNIRSQAGGPFNQSVSGYWDKFSQENPNYEVIRDNDVSTADEQKKFNITKDDISGLNMKNISDTLDIEQNLKDYIGF